MAGEKLARKIKNARPKSSEFSDLVYGRVTQISPVVIQVETGLLVSGKFLELSQMVRDLTISITIDGKTGSATVFRSLRVGDKVRMLRAQKSQKYYVLERV